MLQDASPAAPLELPAYFSILAHFTFGATGALAGLKRGYDFIGVLFLAMVTAAGGGLLRDGLLISQGPVAILRNEMLLFVILAGAVATMLFHRQVTRVARTIAIVDALGLGAFAVHGVQVSAAAGLNGPAVVIGGTITAVGGGLLRDVLTREEPLNFKPGQFYVLFAIGGCCLFMGLMRLGFTTPRVSALITIVVVFALRMLAIRYNWHTRAVYTEPTL